MNVFVHLAYGFGTNTWGPRFKAGQIIGINEDLAYGYQRAQAHGCRVTYSHDHAEGALGRLMRYAVRTILGFDLVHAYRNRHAVNASDIVWTHTESQYLSILMLFAGRRNPPKLIAQTVWLMDRWGKLPLWKRLFYKALMKKADVLTFLSPNNLALAKALLPHNHCALVRFGIRNDQMTAREPRRPDVVNLIAVGNDRDRDWQAVLGAASDWERCNLKIVSTKFKFRAGAAPRNVQVQPASNNEELLALYHWADIALVVLRPNEHASGVTVIQEAILRGVPVIASRAGGLEAYFANGEVHFIESNSAEAIRRAVELIADDPDRQSTMTTRAQELMRTSLNSETFVREHVQLSKVALAQNQTTTAQLHCRPAL